MTSSSDRDPIEALAEEFLARRRRGERPTVEEYAARIPALAEAIRAVFPAMALVDELGPPTEPAVDRRPAPAAESGQVGDYRIVREIGRGGMGVVYEAEQVSLGRRVALKLLHRTAQPASKHRGRFEREAKAAARLHHTNIVPVFGVGEHEGAPYYVMQLIEGRGLDAVIDELRREAAAVAAPRPVPADTAPDSTRDAAAEDVAGSLLDGRYAGTGRDGPPAGGPGSDSEAPTRLEAAAERDATADVAPDPVSDPIPPAMPAGTQSTAAAVATPPRPAPAVSSSSSLLGSGPAGSGRQRARAFWLAVARLGAQVADALAYAHAQGVVHRDIKPSNILIDTRGSAWVADFGLARVNDAPSLTETGDVLGTLRYMPPEAFEGRSGPRGDLYSLGLTLYELIALRPAFDQPDRARLIRAVTEGEPPRLRQLRPDVPRDLETIVQKAIERESSHRYATAAALAEDLRRFVDDRPIAARRVGEVEKLWRLCRRNPVPAALAAAFVTALAVGAAGSAYYAIREGRANAATTKAKDEAEAALAETIEAKRATDEALARSEESLQQAEAVSRFLVEAFRSPDPSVDGREVKVVDVLDRASARLDREFTGSPATEGRLLDTLGTTYRGLGLYDRSLSLHTKATAVRETKLGPDHPDTLASRGNLAIAYAMVGRTHEAIRLFEAKLKPMEAKLGPDHLDTLPTRMNLANAYNIAGRLSEAIALNEGTLKLCEAKLGPDHPSTLRTRHNLAINYHSAGRTAEAIALNEETLKRYEAKLGPDHPSTLETRHNLASTYRAAGRFSEAIGLYEGTLKGMEAKLGPDHPLTRMTRDDLGVSYSSVGRLSEAIALHQATLEWIEANLGPDHPDTLITRKNLANAYTIAGRLSEAIALYERTLKVLEAKPGPDDRDTLWSRGALATIYESLGRCAEAEGLYRDVLARSRKTVQPGSPLLAGDLAALGGNLLNQGRWSEAEPLLRECLTIRERATPDDWDRYDAMSLLGATHSGRGRYAEAEPLLVRGYEGMKARESRIAAPARSRLREAAERVISLYEAWNQPDRATAWKARVGLPDLPADMFARP